VLYINSNQWYKITYATLFACSVFTFQDQRAISEAYTGLQQPMYRVLKGEVNFYGKLNDLATPK